MFDIKMLVKSITQTQVKLQTKDTMASITISPHVNLHVEKTMTKL
jgi:hypothetical protein